MPTQHESPAPAPAAVSGTSQKLLQLLRKRLRQLARVTLVLAICLAVAAAALAIWWLTSLNGLPDIGDPFDVAAFRAFSVPDDQNAFAFLRRADEKLTPIRGGAGGARPGRSEVLVVDRESEVAGVGRGESRGARTVSAGGRTTRRGAPGRRSHSRRGSGRLDRAGPPRGEQATGERRHGGRLGLLSRGPPHDHSHQAAGKHASALFRQEGEPLVCSDGSPTGRRIRGPRSPNFIPPWKKCSRTSRTPIGISLRLNMGISNSCARWSGRCRFPFSRRSRGNGRFGSATWRFRRHDRVISRPRAASSCASPNAAGASCGCSVPTTWRTRKPASCRRGNRPSGRCSLT